MGERFGAEDEAPKVKPRASEDDGRSGSPEEPSDVEYAMSKLQEMGAGLSRVVRLGKLLDDLVQRNQNEGCGGDRQMSPEQWTALRDVVQAIDALKKAGAALAKAPNKPLLCDMAYAGMDANVLGEGDEIPF